jgi:hypothetical protein
MRLCELHRYEAARRAPLAEEVYRTNAALILPDDANAYRFELTRRAAPPAAAPGGPFRLPTPAPEVKQEPAANGGGAAPEAEREAGGGGGGGGGGGREAVALTVQLMDPDRVEAHPAGLDPVFGDYMRGFMASPAAGAEGKEGLVFLPRHARAAAPGAGRRAAPDEPVLQELLGRVCVSNGLECKISCANSKVSYVLDTEDVLWRRGPRRRGPRRRAAAAAGAGEQQQQQQQDGAEAGQQQPEQQPAHSAPCPVARHAARYAEWLAAREAALRDGFQPYASSFPEPMAT